jgi:hypothetical protein
MLTLTEGLASKLRNSLWTLQTEITRLGRLVNDPTNPEDEILHYLGKIAKTAKEIQKLSQPLTETSLKKGRKKNANGTSKIDPIAS